ncbi:ABC transporter substrate-binding protein [Litoreibacter roseus]|uniref:ABC transporter substrate-binding protein n=1 Tax=Litoreibacter roseus TaxID=2601869 RepID=A0A6N6JEZ2_9RHOB|nr:ABC transporter substrate-binding protein [Litoreibacter roseus]GFE63939.1 ABC transporter substrate-binding protein [Litoreibacter roseus]
MRSFFRLIAAVIISTCPIGALADQGVTDTSVTFAQIASLDGPASALGQGMRQGILAAFAEANGTGGVHGRRLQLVSMDDGYEPGRSVAHLREVIDSNDYIGLIGLVGTPTTKATQPIARAAGLPSIGPLTGAAFLRDETNGNVLNVRASYSAETEEWIRHLVDVKGYKKIAILYQNDDFGRIGLQGVRDALNARDLELVAEGSYTRNTTAVKTALLSIRKAEPDAVVTVGPYRPIAEFIKLGAKLSFKPDYVGISFVGAQALAAELGGLREGVIVSQVVPLPWDTSLPVVASYQAALTELGGDLKPGFVSLEGYFAGRLAIEALQSAGKNLTRQALMAAMSNLRTVELGGAAMRFGEGDNQGMDQVFLTQITASGSFDQVSATQ